jgi:gliding motility-associated-like protein
MKKRSTGFVLMIFIIGWLVINAKTLNAQTSSFLGKEYTFEYRSNYFDGEPDNETNIYSKNGCMLMIKIFNNNNSWDTTLTLSANSQISFRHGDSPWIQHAIYNSTDSNYYIKISASDSLFVFGAISYVAAIVDFCTYIPDKSIGYNYIIPGAYMSSSQNNLVYSFENNNALTIIPSANANNNLLQANIPYNIMLDSTEAFRLFVDSNVSCSTSWDTLEMTKYLAGSIIRSQNCKKFRMTNKTSQISSFPLQFFQDPLISEYYNQIINTPYNNLYDTAFYQRTESLLNEDLFPVNTMGRKYICSPPPNGLEIITFTAPFNNTIISINGTVWDTLNSGECKVKLFKEPSYIEATHSISVAISHSLMRDTNNLIIGGACFIQIPALEQTAKSGWFYYTSAKYTNSVLNSLGNIFFTNEKSYIIVVTPTSGANQTFLDNNNIGAMFHPVIGNPQYSSARIEVFSGPHEISNINGLIVWSTSYNLKTDTDPWDTNLQSYGSPLVMCFKSTDIIKIDTVAIENTLNTPYSICLGSPLKYSIVSNVDSTMNINWDFGDGNWGNGDTVMHTYADTGYYHVNLFVNSYCDTIKGLVHVVAPPVIALGNDTTICHGSSLLLDASVSGNATYLWSTGSTSPQITVGDAGTYHVTATTDAGCEVSDTIHVSMHPTVNVNLGNDTVLCYLAHILLDATQPYETHSNYVWQDQSTNSTYTVINQGQYWVVVTNLCTQKSDTINIENLMNPTLYLGNDTTICMNHKLLLDASIPWGINYQWENGSTNATRLIENEGLYWVEASNPCVSVSDTIFIKVDDCDPLLIMPNVFTPDNDGLNDVFKAGSIRNVISLHLMIFNRWGDNILQSNNLDFAWDGRFKNQKCPEGVYFWVIQYVDINGDKHDLSGTVTLLR